MRTRTVLLSLAIVASLGGCTATAGTDKAGDETIVLRVAVNDGLAGNGQTFGPNAFIDNLKTLSGGRIKLQIQTNYGGGSVNAESDLVKAIGAGTVDVGWPSTRSFAGAGILGVEGIEAPMQITSYNAERELVSGPAAQIIEGKINKSPVRALALAVGPLRRPFSGKAPLLGLSDWKGARFHTFNSPAQSATLTALGAVPVPVGQEWVDQMRAGTLRGIDFDVAQYLTNDTDVASSVTANVVLWPKVFVLSINAKRFEGLTATQQHWIQDAATRASMTSTGATYDEVSPLPQVCARGLRLFSASPADLLALRNAVDPVTRRLAADPVEGDVTKAVERVAADFPAADSLSPPPGCTAPVVNDVLGPIPTAPSNLPDGVYRSQITVAEVLAAGLKNSDGNSGTWTLTVSHGTFVLACGQLADPGTDCGHSMGPSHPVEMGDLRGSGSTVYYVGLPSRLADATGCLMPISESLPNHCGPAGLWRGTWSLTSTQLTFSNLVPPPYTGYEVTLKPWTKVS